MVRENKHQPSEVSSKQPVSVLRQVVQASKPKCLDPRFDRAFGAFHADQFHEAYGFVRDIQKSERQTLEDTMRKEKNPERSSAIRRALDRQKSIERSLKQQEARRSLMKEWKEKERTLVKEGKKPFYLKKSDQKKLELVQKFQVMKERQNGRELNVDKLTEKRRKRKAAKQHTRLPFATPSDYQKPSSDPKKSSKFTKSKK